MNFVYGIKRYIPGPVWSAITRPYWWWYNRARHQAATLFDHRLASSRARLEAFRDVHRRQRCFIIGNGPSLKKTDLSLLRDEFTFGMNRFYLMFPELGFGTSYYVAVNTLVIEQCAQDIKSLPMPCFLTWRGRRWFGRGDDVLFVDTDYTPPAKFSGDVTGRVFEGSTVTFVALELAYFMGFEEVILIGVDHSFETKGQPNLTVVSTGDDPNHFSPEYFGKGFRWQLPDLEASEQAYRLADEAYRRGGRRIIDATVGGKLEVFPKVTYDSLFG